MKRPRRERQSWHQRLNLPSRRPDLKVQPPNHAHTSRRPEVAELEAEEDEDGEDARVV